MWWVISFNPLGGKATYHYFQGTKAQAQTLANEAVDGSVTGPFATKAAAQAAVKSGKLTPPSGPQPVNIHNPLSAITDWASALTTVLKDLTERNTWVRILKIVLGGVVIIVGVLHISEVKDLGKTIGKVGEVAAL